MNRDDLLELFVHAYTITVSYQLVQYDHSDHILPCAIATVILGYVFVGVTRNSHNPIGV